MTQPSPSAGIDHLEAEFQRLTGPSNKEGGSFFSVTWQTEPWEALLKQVKALEPARFEVMKEMIGRRLIRRLPIPSQVDETTQEFQAGKGVLAMVGLLERNFGFSSSRETLVHLGGAGAAEIYLQLLAAVALARKIDARSKQGTAGYFLPNGLPNIDEGDRLHIFPDKPSRLYYEKALALGAWPLHFDWPALLFPTDRAIQVGAFGWAKILGALTILFLVTAIIPFPFPEKLWQMAATVVAMLVVRLIFPFFVARLGTLQAVTRIMEADKLGRVGVAERMISTVFSMSGNSSGEKGVAPAPLETVAMNGTTGAPVRAANFARYRRLIRFADFLTLLVLVGYIFASVLR